MTKANKKHDDHNDDNGKPALRAAQIELVKLQRHVIQSEEKVLVILEGRDAAGKDGTVKRIAQHLSPRETRIVALGVPSDRDKRSWYFQRYIAHLPVGGEIALFNRSWYNRAGVEHVMSFCTAREYEMFLKAVPIFEDLLVHCGVTLIKYYLDISRAEQKTRLQQRHDDPLSQWKLSRIDEKALKHWDDYTEARDEMLARTHSVFAPWTIVRADDKPSARLNLIRDLLTRFEFDGKNHEADLPDPDVVFTFSEGALKNGQLAR
ncbi:MAG: polyphosphate kinase 2 [Pigmentiphaga sp.]